MTKQEVIKIIENWIEENLEKQNNKEESERKITFDIVYAYRNVELECVLDLINQMN